MSQRSITVRKSVTFSYPNEIEVTISRDVYPDDPDDPGCKVYTVDLDKDAGQARFSSIRDLRRYHKAIGYFLDQMDKEGGDE